MGWRARFALPRAWVRVAASCTREIIKSMHPHVRLRYHTQSASPDSRRAITELVPFATSAVSDTSPVEPFPRFRSLLQADDTIQLPRPDGRHFHRMYYVLFCTDIKFLPLRKRTRMWGFPAFPKWRSGGVSGVSTAFPAPPTTPPPAMVVFS